MSDRKEFHKVSAIDAGKAVAPRAGRELREGEKPSAPANLVMPKPVAVPIASTKVSDKK
jgi:hypothetical protein